jgi:hypothetical protein
MPSERLPRSSTAAVSLTSSSWPAPRARVPLPARPPLGLLRPGSGGPATRLHGPLPGERRDQPPLHPVHAPKRPLGKPPALAVGVRGAVLREAGGPRAWGARPLRGICGPRSPDAGGRHRVVRRRPAQGCRPRAAPDAPLPRRVPPVAWPTLHLPLRHKWRDIQPHEISDPNASEERIRADDKPVSPLEYVVAESEKPIPEELARLAHDASVVYYQNSQGESRSAPAAPAAPSSTHTARRRGDTTAARS